MAVDDAKVALLGVVTVEQLAIVTTAELAEASQTVVVEAEVEPIDAVSSLFWLNDTSDAFESRNAVEHFEFSNEEL